MKYSQTDIDLMEGRTIKAAIDHAQGCVRRYAPQMEAEGISSEDAIKVMPRVLDAILLAGINAIEDRGLAAVLDDFAACYRSYRDTGKVSTATMRVRRKDG